MIADIFLAASVAVSCFVAATTCYQVAYDEQPEKQRLAAIASAIIVGVCVTLLGGS